MSLLCVFGAKKLNWTHSKEKKKLTMLFYWLVFFPAPFLILSAETLFCCLFRHGCLQVFCCGFLKETGQKFLQMELYERKSPLFFSDSSWTVCSIFIVLQIFWCNKMIFWGFEKTNCLQLVLKLWNLIVLKKESIHLWTQCWLNFHTNTFLNIKTSL